MRDPWKKPTHASIHATEMCFGGVRATVFRGKEVVASVHFPAKGWGKKHVDAAYDAAKSWLAGFGLE